MAICGFPNDEKIARIPFRIIIYLQRWAAHTCRMKWGANALALGVMGMR